MKNPMAEVIKNVCENLTAHNVISEVYQFLTLPIVCVEISWGDWKHDHLRADNLIQEIGGKLIKTDLVEDDGSDCYSAVHYYAF